MAIEDLIQHHDKAIRVIMSCETRDQLDVAERFCVNLLRLHAKRASLLTAPTEKILYGEKISESEEKLLNCLSHRNKFLKRLKRR